jgi:phage portal protein BeeE
MKIFGFNINVSRAGRAEAPTLKRSTSLSPGMDWLTGGSGETGGATMTNAYQQVVWVYRAINALAEQVANVPFLFSTGGRGRESLITSGPLLDFYGRPHPQISAFEYWELRVIWLMLRGECFRVPVWEEEDVPASERESVKALERARSTLHASTLNAPTLRRLKRVLILDPAHFQHIIQDNQLVGWRYTGFGPQTPLESQVFLPEEVWFEKLPNPFDFWRGMPPLYAAASAARTDFAAAAFMRGIIENNADTGVIVRTEQPLGEEQEAQVFAALRARKRGAGLADKPMLLTGVSEIIKPELSSSDLQFLENRKFTRSEICAAFGVPEEIVCTSDHNKYDVMQGARQNFIENRVAPLCRRLEAEERQVVRAIDLEAEGWFDLDSLPIMQAAQRARLAAARAAFDMGVPFNELNRVLDLGFKPLAWGDEGWVASGMQKASGK